MQATKTGLIKTLQAIISPHYNHWVLFQNDSFIVFKKKPQDMEDRALELIRYYGCQRKGGTNSDYEATPIEGQDAWLVRCYYKGIFTYVHNTEVKAHAPIKTAVSIKGLEKRRLDGETPVIVHLESK